MIYLDHAASSWPKPPAVIEAVTQTLTNNGANPGRGSHQMAMQASRIIFDARTKLARLFSIKNANQIIMTKNTTEALNLAIMGVLKTGDHVISTSIEHNSVRRPLEYLVQEKQVTVSYLNHDQYGIPDYSQIKQLIQPRTRLMIVTHGSNVLGTIIDLQKIKEQLIGTNVYLLVDAAQTAGAMPISVNELEIDLLAFPGHKSLLGPQGTGGLYVGSNIELEPMILGGTGSRAEEIEQPKTMPEGYESGTLNTPGISGLAAGIDYVIKQDLKEHHQQEFQMIQKVLEAIQSTKNIRSIGPAINEDRCGLVTFTHQGMDASEISFILDRHFDIAVRSGYHCAPMAHQIANTIKTGAVRASLGWSTTADEIEQFISAIQALDQT